MCTQCAQKHARRVIYKLNKFPLQKGTLNDYERHPFLVTINIVQELFGEFCALFDESVLFFFNYFFFLTL